MERVEAGIVVIDWGQVDPTYRENITRLIQKIAAALHTKHMELWLRVPMGRELKLFDLDAFSVIDPEDLAQPGIEQILERVKNSRQIGGNIVLLHDSGGDRSQTVEALSLGLWNHSVPLEAPGYGLKSQLQGSEMFQPARHSKYS